MTDKQKQEEEMEGNKEITLEKIRLQVWLEKTADIPYYCQIHKITRQEFWRLHLWKE